MNLMTHSLTKNEMSKMLRANINNTIVKALERNYVPWQKPWEGRGEGVGYPQDVRTKKMFFGINFILLQMAAKEHGFISSWWGTSDEFMALGATVKDRPETVVPGNWGTEIILYKGDGESILTVSSIVYNADQTTGKFRPNPKLMPIYETAEKVLHSTKAQIEYNEDGEAWYHYPPDDYISLPRKMMFEAGLGGLPGYYESLAHELVHWTEPRLGFKFGFRDPVDEEAVRELRADISAAMLMEQLAVPHSISFSNFNKWKQHWIKLMKADESLIFRVCASASAAANYVMAFTLTPPLMFNCISESAA